MILKRSMQQLIFYLMLDVQEVVEQIQSAKEGLGQEVKGFDEEDYTGLQKIRIEQAQTALQFFRHIDLGGAAAKKDGLYERPEATEAFVSEMRRYQDIA